MDISLAEAFIALFTIINPIAVVPTFLVLTHGQTPGERNRTALVAATAVMATLLVSLVAGDDILKLFWINLHAFRLAGMAVIAAMAWSMLNAKASQMQHNKSEDLEAEQKDSLGALPGVHG
jgi:multiple antibiotic resistance protein